MSESIIREYEKKDIPSLVTLWCDTFGDTLEFAELFYEMLPNMGSCSVMELDGRIVAMANVITGIELQYAKSLSAKECGYIYAVAVDKHCRGNGYGTEISKAAYALAKKREAEIVCTSPSSESLFDFYKSCIGVEKALFRSKHDVEAGEREMTTKLSATEYWMMRESFLQGKTFQRLSQFTMEYVRKSTELSGGGLYASMSGICCAAVNGDTCNIYEIISQDNDATAASVAHALGCSKAVYYIQDDSGDAYLAADPGSISSDAVWNFILL